MALQQTLKTDMPALLQGFDSAKDRQSQASFARQNLGAARQEQMAAEEEAVLGEAKMKREAAGRQAGIEEQFAKDIRQTSQDFQAKRQEQAPFDASQFTLTPEQAAVDSFKTLVGGLLFGGIAKAGAGAMLEATIKMREARDKNMQNEYLTALQGYERESKRVKEFNKQLLDDMATAIDLLSTDKSAALAKAKLVEANIEDGVMKSKLRAGNWKGFVEDLQKVVNEDNKRQAEMDKLRYQRETDLLKEQERAKNKPTGGTLKPSAKILEGYIANNILALDLEGLTNDLKDPELAKAIMDYRAEAFATEELGKIAAQILQPELPEKLRRFLTKVRDIRNNYYLDISGKAVTGGEAMRNYGTVPTPGDTPDVIRDKIGGMAGRLKAKIKTTQSLYALPDLNQLPVAPGARTSLVPGQNYETESGAETVYRPQTEEEFNKLPSGALYVDPDDGKKYRKP